MDHIDLVIAKLKNEKDDSERNSLALDLAELRDHRILLALIELIEREDLVNSRGTLVYCLNNFDVSDYFILLVRLIVSGNWEVAHESFDLIDSLNEVSSNQVAEGFKLLKAAVENDALEEWRLNMMEDVLSMF